MKKHVLYWFLCLFPLTLAAQVADSSAQIADSSAQQVTRELPIPFQHTKYVNASSLMLRASPTATGRPLATIAGASLVEVLTTRFDGWSQVRVGGRTGYVKSDYLVVDQEEVRAEIDWEQVEQAGGLSYASVIPIAVPTPTKRGVTKQAISPKVYICNNGRTVVYHNSEGCSAMRRCTYVARVVTARDAREEGLRECMKCY